MTSRTPRRYTTAGAARRRQPRIRRASAGLSPVRAGAILAMLVSAGAIYGLVATSAFGFTSLEINGTAVTPADDIRQRLDLAAGTNLITLETESLAARVREIPSVAGAEVSVGLPDHVRVDVVERVPILVWAVGQRRFLVDDSGSLFADAAATPADVVAKLPVVRDERARSASLAVKSTLDPVDLDAATRLGSLTPDKIGSSATALAVAVTDGFGFTVMGQPMGWLAIFGYYVPSQRTPAMIPGQVQALREVLVGREDQIESVVLADDRKGTFQLKPSPKPSKAP